MSELFHRNVALCCVLSLQVVLDLQRFTFTTNFFSNYFSKIIYLITSYYHLRISIVSRELPTYFIDYSFILDKNDSIFLIALIFIDTK